MLRKLVSSIIWLKIGWYEKPKQNCVLSVEFFFRAESLFMLSTIQSKCDRFWFLSENETHITLLVQITVILHIESQTCDWFFKCTLYLIENGNVNLHGKNNICQLKVNICKGNSLRSSSFCYYQRVNTNSTSCLMFWELCASIQSGKSVAFSYHLDGICIHFIDLK